jgi:hypothetical protein
VYEKVQNAIFIASQCDANLIWSEIKRDNEISLE